MIKVLKLEPNLNEKTLCTLYADTKDEVTGTLDIIGLPDGVTPDTGSTIVTSKFEIAVLDSEGTWNWLGGEE